jgi:hypothetical protein
MDSNGLRRQLRDRALRIASAASKAALGEARRAVKAQVAMAVRRVFRHDRRKRSLSVSDEALLPALRALAARLAPEAMVTLEPATDGLLVGARLGGKRVSAVVRLERVELRGGRVMVVVGTPQGIELAGRPVAQLLAGLVARLLGGTWLGKKLLSAPLPSRLTWDGATATLCTDLDPAGRLPAALGKLGASAAISRANGWTTFTLDGDEALALLAPVVGRAIADALGPAFLGLLDGQDEPPAAVAE